MPGIPKFFKINKDKNELNKRCNYLVAAAGAITAITLQREEKQLEASLDALLSQVADLKNSLGSFIYKLENEYDRLTW